jgi:ribosomal-protein-alanine N-acetyltransferase
MSEADVASVASIEGPTRVTEEQLRAELGRPWARLWVARDVDDAVVGFALAWRVADEVHLLNLATAPACRRRGIGAAMMAEIIAFARRIEAVHVLLEARRSNVAALALYAKLGFEQTRARLRYYPDDEDAIEMMLQLGPAPPGNPPHDA